MSVMSLFSSQARVSGVVNSSRATARSFLNGPRGGPLVTGFRGWCGAAAARGV